MLKDFELLSDITNIETIAINLSIRERGKTKARFGGRRWRKLKGVALIRFPTERCHGELYWYEAHGAGRRKMKVKRVLD